MSEFAAGARIGWVTVTHFEFLNGITWGPIPFGFVTGLRTTALSIVKDGYQLLDSPDWGVTVVLEEDGKTIKRIEQKMLVSLPDGIENGAALFSALDKIQDEPNPK